MTDQLKKLVELKIAAITLQSDEEWDQNSIAYYQCYASATKLKYLGNDQSDLRAELITLQEEGDGEIRSTKEDAILRKLERNEHDQNMFQFEHEANCIVFKHITGREFTLRRKRTVDTDALRAKWLKQA